MYNGVGVRFADFLSLLFTLRPNYFIFIGHLKLGGPSGSATEDLPSEGICS